MGRRAIILGVVILEGNHDNASKGDKDENTFDELDLVLHEDDSYDIDKDGSCIAEDWWRSYWSCRESIVVEVVWEEPEHAESHAQNNYLFDLLF